MLPNFNAKRVLIVENDLMFAEQSSQILQNAGYYIQVAYNSGDALYAVDNGHFDVALINTTMRDRNGDAILDQISTHPVFRRLPIVSFSGLDGRVTQSALPRPTTDDEFDRQFDTLRRLSASDKMPNCRSLKKTTTRLNPAPRQWSCCVPLLNNSCHSN